LVEVIRGDISQEIFESGQVNKGDKINLTFKNAGRIKKIHAETGDEIEAGRVLAELETSELQIQLQEAQASLELAQLNLNKLLAGSSREEIQIAEAQTENARIALKVAEENLSNSYETALTVLDNSYPQIYNASDFAKKFVEDYVAVYDDDGRKIMSARDSIEEEEKRAKTYLEKIKSDSNQESLESALLAMKSCLEQAFNNLETIRHIVSKSVIYENKVSTADKASLDILKTSINSALANVISSQQTISSTKSSFETAKSNLQESEARLNLTKAGIRQEDIDLYKAQIKQAEIRVRLYENQLLQSKLVSPIDGTIAEVKKKEGELVQPTFQDAVLLILPKAPYEIKVDIYEEDVVKMNIGNSVEITLVAFPRETFNGKIILISPAEKIIDGVVYYEAVVGFEEMPENIKPGMTADIVIKPDIKENVLIIPRETVQRKEGKTIVEVLADGSVKEKEIEIGLRATDDMVEVIFGLSEGEKVIKR